MRALLEGMAVAQRNAREARGLGHGHILPLHSLHGAQIFYFGRAIHPGEIGIERSQFKQRKIGKRQGRLGRIAAIAGKRLQLMNQRLPLRLGLLQLQERAHRLDFHLVEVEDGSLAMLPRPLIGLAQFDHRPV